MGNLVEISPAIALRLHEITPSDEQTLVRIGPERPDIRRPRVFHVPVSTPNAGETVVVGYLFEAAGESKAFECLLSKYDNDWETVGCQKIAELIHEAAMGVSVDTGERTPIEFDGPETTVDRILSELEGFGGELEILR
ncbi:hypothetical protein [Salinigranum marinum]|uniref:hypothetical protein n=1 Tax=Salinigranum marinum TaxID=1515595 RepID=UPI002989E84E|nr:hypothetical protein [Salinigranum marinum]